MYHFIVPECIVPSFGPSLRDVRGSGEALQPVWYARAMDRGCSEKRRRCRINKQPQI